MIGIREANGFPRPARPRRRNLRYRPSDGRRGVLRGQHHPHCHHDGRSHPRLGIRDRPPLTHRWSLRRIGGTGGLGNGDRNPLGQQRSSARTGLFHAVADGTTVR
jgi:hypothetical protein